MTSRPKRSAGPARRAAARTSARKLAAATCVDYAEVAQFLRMARACAAESLPWFAPALFATRLVVTEHCPSLAGIDDGLRVYFNPSLVAELIRHTERRRAMLELAWVWVHEISHFLREHRDRAREHNAKDGRWNVAADLEINDADWSPLEPPRRWPPLVPAAFSLPTGQLAEHYYRRLPDTLECESDEAACVWWDEGSGVHGHARPWELDVHTRDAVAVSTPEQRAVRLHVAMAISEHKSRGSVPAGWRRWAEQLHKPQVNWRTQLRRRVRGAVTMGLGGRLDYTYQRASRRASAYEPVVCPSLQGDRVPRVACVVDTSGSMSEHDLCQCMSEVRGVLAALHTPVTVIPCDAVAYEPVRVLTESQSLHVKLQGGGGTDMVAGIESALALQPPPHLVIVLTDGWTPYPARRYTTPVVFGILSARSSLPPVAPPMPPWRPSDFITIKIDHVG